MKGPLIGLVLLLGSVCLAKGQLSYHKTVTGIALHFEHRVGDQPLHVDSAYRNPFNETFTVTKFRYYISHITFHGSSPVSIDTTFLVDEMMPESKTILLPVPAGRYDSLSFLLGVDSSKNVSGIQSGALDPLQDMFWTWNTGYVMAKLEGTSSASTLPRRMIEYHIGGFAGPYNVLKTIHLRENIIRVSEDRATQIAITADLQTWFKGVHALPIAKEPACTTKGALALQYADNYSHMFTISAVTTP